MADLPRERVTCARPFSNCGVDFAGPLLRKDSEVRKIYVAVFICMATKAVHLEPVSSLKKDICMLALKRLASMRGMPSMFFSDNATYFIGARNDLLRIQELLDKRNENSIASHVNRQGFQWLTIPPRSPHYGRLWEAAVESVKRHMKRVIGLQLLYEEFLTVLDQIEAILNLRPLSIIRRPQ